MIYPVCAVRDSKTQFWPPQVHETIESAKRDFAMAINAGQGAPAFAPGDFDMYHIADFDSLKGTIEPVSPIDQICSGVNVYGVNYEK